MPPAPARWATQVRRHHEDGHQGGKRRHTDVKFKTFGCCAAIATSSMATEMVKGKSIDEALQLTNKAVAEALDGCPR